MTTKHPSMYVGYASFRCHVPTRLPHVFVLCPQLWLICVVRGDFITDEPKPRRPRHHRAARGNKYGCGLSCRRCCSLGDHPHGRDQDSAAVTQHERGMRPALALASSFLQSSSPLHDTHGDLPMCLPYTLAPSAATHSFPSALVSGLCHISHCCA